MKVGRLVQNDMSTAAMWSKWKPEVKFQYGRHLFFSKPEIVISQPLIELKVRGLLIETDIRQLMEKT